MPLNKLWYSYLFINKVHSLNDGTWKLLIQHYSLLRMDYESFYKPRWLKRSAADRHSNTNQSNNNQVNQGTAMKNKTKQNTPPSPFPASDHLCALSRQTAGM